MVQFQEAHQQIKTQPCWHASTWPESPLRSGSLVQLQLPGLQPGGHVCLFYRTYEKAVVLGLTKLKVVSIPEARQATGCRISREWRVGLLVCEAHGVDIVTVATRHWKAAAAAAGSAGSGPGRGRPGGPGPARAGRGLSSLLLNYEPEFG